MARFPALCAFALAAYALPACAFDGNGVDFGDGGPGSDGHPGSDGGGDAGNQRTSLERGDMRLVFGEVASDRIRTKRWSIQELDWLDGVATDGTTGAPLWPVTVVGPGEDPDEIIATQLKRVTGQRLTTHLWNGTSWAEGFTRDTALTSEAQRGFDVAFERSSGDALAVYVNDTNTPAFRTFSGGIWSAEQSLPLNDGPDPNPDTNLGIVHWIELESLPGTDRIGLVFSDSNRDLVAMVWDGEGWIASSAHTLETNLKENDISFNVANRVFDLAFESQSGDLMVSWGQESQSWPWYQIWSSATGMWLPDKIRESNIVSGHPHYIDLASDPETDRIVGGFYDLGDGTERLGVGVWSGAAWVDKQELDSQTRDVNDGAVGDMPGAVGWLHASGVAVCIYADDQAGTLDWARWEQSRGWTLESDVAFSGKGFTESVQLRATPDGERMVVLLSDDSLNLFTTTYNGSSWRVSNNGEPLTGVLAAGNAVSFSISVRE